MSTKFHLYENGKLRHTFTTADAAHAAFQEYTRNMGPERSCVEVYREVETDHSHEHTMIAHKAWRKPRLMFMDAEEVPRSVCGFIITPEDK
jgi:hypothetical protein